jgi:hypothetical protein
LNTKPDFSQVDISLNTKPTFLQVDNSLNTKPTFSQVDISLNTKPDFSQVDNSLNTKPTFLQVDNSLNTKPTFQQVDTSMNFRALIASPIFTGIVTADKVTVGDASFNGNVDISGVLSVTQTTSSVVTNTTINNYNVSVTNDLSLNGNLDVSGDVYLNNKLYVKNDASFNGRVDICGNLYAQYPSNSIPVSAIIDGVTLYYVNTSLTSKANTASPTFTGTISANDLSLSGNVIVHSKLTVNSDALFNGRLVQWS